MTNKLLVFLSSVQYKDELTLEREGLGLAFSKLPLSATFNLWRIEDEGASPDKIEEYYLKNVARSQAVILILGRTIRDAVIKEYEKAHEKTIPVFAYIKKSVPQDEKLQGFINTRVFTNVTASPYISLKDLVEKVESDLFRWLIEPRLLQQEKMAPPERQKILATEISRDEKTLRLLSSIVFGQDAETTQKEIFKNLIIALILKSDSQTIEHTAILLKINEVLTLTTKSRDILSKTIDTMIAEKTLLINNPEPLVLSLNPPLVKSINENFAKQTDEENKAFYDLYENTNVKSFLTINEFKQIIDNIVAEILTKDALLFAEEILEKFLVADPYNKQSLERSLSDAIVTLKPKGGISIWYPIIYDLFTTSNKISQIYLVEKFKSYFILLILNLDPDCTKYQITHLKRYTVFVDSHIALRAMVNAGGSVDICKKIIIENQQRGIQTFITKPMFYEILNSFKFANDVYLQQRDPEKIAAFYKQLGKSSDIFDGYLKMERQKPGLNWESYINIFWAPTRPKVLEDFLKNEMDIEVFKESDSYDVAITESINRITDMLLDIRKQQIDAGDYSQEDLKKYERDLRLRKNEAYTMFLIYHLRNQVDYELFSETWFLTFDEFVYKANTLLAKTDENYLHPCYYKPARWLELLSVFASKPLEESVFRQLLLSEEVKRIATIIEAEVIQKMLEKRVDEKFKKIQSLRNMFTELVNRPAIQDAYEAVLKLEGVALLKKSEEIEKLLRDEIVSEVNKLRLDVEKTKKEKDRVLREKEEVLQTKEQLQKDKEKEQRRTKYYKTQLGNLRSQIDKKYGKKRKKK